MTINKDKNENEPKLISSYSFLFSIFILQALVRTFKHLKIKPLSKRWYQLCPLPQENGSKNVFYTMLKKLIKYDQVSIIKDKPFDNQS